MFKRLLPIAVMWFSLPAAYAHHAQSAYYDTNSTVEIEGILTEARWRNPHMSFTVLVEDGTGAQVEWAVEATSLSLIRMLGTERGFIQEGDRIKVAGSPGRRSPTSMYALNILTPGGEEILLSGGAKARWTTPAAVSKGELANASAEAIAADDDAGIFRTWSTIQGPGSNRLWEDDYPLTEWAAEKRAAWDPVADNPAMRCEPKGFPTIIDPPYPIELVDQGSIVLYKQEEFDTVRTIYMNESHEDREVAANIYGHSVGYWEDDVLVVETIDSSWPFFDNLGVPHTPNTHYVERFWLSEDRSRLQYTLTATDSEVFTRPLTLDRAWIWRPDIKIQPFNCTL